MALALAAAPALAPAREGRYSPAHPDIPSRVPHRGLVDNSAHEGCPQAEIRHSKGRRTVDTLHRSVGFGGACVSSPLMVDPVQLSRLAAGALATSDTLDDLASAVRQPEPDGPAVYGDTGAARSLATFQSLWAAEARLAAAASREFAEALRRSADSYLAADDAALRR